MRRKPAPPPIPPGHWRDRKTGEERRDKLAELEEWADAHPERMTPERWDRIEALKAEYDAALALLLDWLDHTPDGLWNDLPLIEGQHDLGRQVLWAALRRAMQDGTLQKWSVGYAGAGFRRPLPVIEGQLAERIIEDDTKRKPDTRRDGRSGPAEGDRQAALAL